VLKGKFFNTAPHLRILKSFVKVTPWLTLVEQELFTIQQHLSSTTVSCWVHVAQSLVFGVVF
jgi:hypothetical protein